MLLLVFTGYLEERFTVCLAQFTCVNKFPILNTLNENYSNKQHMKVNTRQQKGKEYKVPGKSYLL